MPENSLLPYVLVYCPQCRKPERLHVKIFSVALDANPHTWLTVEADFVETTLDHDCDEYEPPAPEVGKVKVGGKKSWFSTKTDIAGDIHDKNCQCDTCKATAINDPQARLTRLSLQHERRRRMHVEYSVMDHATGNFVTIPIVPKDDLKTFQNVVKRWNSEDWEWKEPTPRYEVWYREVTYWEPIANVKDYG